jgi:hypothetical protein
MLIEATCTNHVPLQTGKHHDDELLRSVYQCYSVGVARAWWGLWQMNSCVVHCHFPGDMFAQVFYSWLFIIILRSREEELLYILRKLLDLQLWPGTLWAAFSDSPSSNAIDQSREFRQSFSANNCQYFCLSD